MGIFRIKAGEHVIRDTPFADYLRRHLRDENLFTGFNTKSGRWFLGLWLRKDQGIAQDIEDLGTDLELADRRLVRDLEQSRDGVTKEDIKKGFAQHERDYLERQSREAEEFQDVQNWVQKKSGSPVPAIIG